MRGLIAQVCPALIATALFAPPLSAQPPVEIETQRARALTLAVDSRFGTSKAPYFTPAFPEVRGQALLLRFDAELAVSRRVRVGLRVPLVLARVEQPAGALFGEAAWANPELSTTFIQPWLQDSGWRLSSATALSLSLPLAEHASASSQLEGRTLALADAVEGFSEPELYTPGVLPITLAERLTLDGSRWTFGASLKLPFLIRVSDASLPSDSETHPLGIEPVADVSARLRVLRWLSVSGKPQLTLRALSLVDDPASPLQLQAVLGIQVRLASSLELAALFQAPVIGELAGDTFASGLRLTFALGAPVGPPK